MDGWTSGQTAHLVLKNSNPTAVTPFTTFYPGLSVTLHPQSGGLQAVARWTAPTAGLYDISGAFSAGDLTNTLDRTTTDVQVFANDTVLAFGDVDGPTSVSFTESVSLMAGDTVDFVVGRGADNSFNFDGTILAATISTPPVPLPAGLPLLAAGLGGFALVRRKKLGQ